MMSSGNRDENSAAAAASTSLKAPSEQTLKCPRCDSSNTKFCYYNNYSLTQPRHFCKTCRRYWTKGGALRNVPIGGGCRKTKKSSSSKTTSSSSSNKEYEYASSSDMGSLKFLRQTLPRPPTMDFQIAQNPRIPYNHLSDVITTNYPLPCPSIGFMGAAPMSSHTTLASSIESLSSINQDLHWKLQQQRYAAISLSRNDSSPPSAAAARVVQVRPPQNTMLFQNLEPSRQDEPAFYGGAATGTLPTQNEWFFDSNINSFTLPAPGTTANGAALNSDGGNTSGNNAMSSNWNAVQGWSEQQFGGLP